MESICVFKFLMQEVVYTDLETKKTESVKYYLAGDSEKLYFLRKKKDETILVSAHERCEGYIFPVDFIEKVNKLFEKYNPVELMQLIFRQSES